jgi:UDP-glucose 4-epimerase
VELLEVMEEVMSYKSKVTFDLPRPGDIYRSVGSSERASAILGFQATTSLVDGLTQTAAWLKGS